MTIIIEKKLHFSTGRHGKKELRLGVEPEHDEPQGRVPRIAKLMALAIRFEQLIEDGVVENYAELARLGRVTRARLSQIMNLRLLPPDIQEEILFLPLVTTGGDPIAEREIRPLLRERDWGKQRRMWRELQRSPTA